MLISWQQGPSGWHAYSVGVVWTSIAILTIVEPPRLNICETAVVSLNLVRAVVSLTPDRSVKAICS